MRCWACDCERLKQRSTSAVWQPLEMNNIIIKSDIILSAAAATAADISVGSALSADR